LAKTTAEAARGHPTTAYLHGYDAQGNRVDASDRIIPLRESR
jgi:hypothetical protein